MSDTVRCRSTSPFSAGNSDNYGVLIGYNREMNSWAECGAPRLENDMDIGVGGLTHSQNDYDSRKSEAP